MRKSFYVDTPPARRSLKIFAFDPMLARTSGKRISIEIGNETDLAPGPRGSRVVVVDYDGANQCYYAPVDLNDPTILMRGGLEPNESDPRFHQQMVYAVSMKVLENFELALGRKIRFRNYKPLRIFPHAFEGANAFYDPDMMALLFGYFKADKVDPGPNLPGQTVFTCLSHDIIAHEMTHALVDRLRKFFIEPSNRDVGAFHEGFSDIVAIFQHFSFAAILRDLIQETRSDLRSPTALIDLAREFGYATGSGKAMRSAVDVPDPKLYETTFEPHDRGAILVAAVFDAFFVTYQRRIKDLVRIATGGTGQLPQGDLHPDLVNRIASEASAAAQSILTMCIRAFEYLPPVDITFGDFLRAVVTADFELSPEDETGERAAMIEAFRVRGIYPDDVASLAEESLIWESPEKKMPPFPATLVGQLLIGAQSLGRPATPGGVVNGGGRRAPAAAEATFDPSNPAHDEFGVNMAASLRVQLHAYAKQNAVALGLDPDRRISVRGFHPAFRVSPRGELLVELVAQFAQRDERRDEQLGGVPLRGGTTVVASADGEVRYIISKPLHSPKLSPEQRRAAGFRLERQLGFVDQCDRTDPRLPWADARYFGKRIANTMNFAAMHRGSRR